MGAPSTYLVETMTAPPATSLAALIGGYDALLFDAFGVLVDATGALPGAAAAIDRLNAAAKPYYILSNSAARLPETMAAHFAAQGLAIPAERILTSGLLLADHFRDRGLTGRPCLVLGPDESRELCRRAGGEPVPFGAEAEVVVIADQKGFDLQAGLDAALSLVLRRLDAGLPVELILCNPDLIYPLAPQQYGFTSGGLALMLEGVLAERYPGRDLRFTRLGKPHAPLFEAAARLAGSRRLVMIGDQLATDILGANRFGIDSALILSGLAHAAAAVSPTARPTYLLPSLAA